MNVFFVQVTSVPRLTVLTECFAVVTENNRVSPALNLLGFNLFIVVLPIQSRRESRS